MSANKDGIVCDYNEFRRTRYFHGMLLDDKDFISEQGYHAGKRRLLNRMLHGSGIVCGLQACWNKTTGKIVVSPGLALDCCGNEIWVNHNLELSISQFWTKPQDAKKPDACSEPSILAAGPYQLVIRYKETETDLVSVYLPGAGCDERACEHSRTKEGSCLELVAGGDCPPYQLPDDPCKELDEGDRLAKCGQPGDCPECGPCDKPCHIILGSLTLDEKGSIQVPDGDEQKAINAVCRRYVLTGRLLWQMIGRTFKAGKAPAGEPAGSWISIPGSNELTNNPVEALCLLLQYLNGLPATTVPRTDFDNTKRDFDNTKRDFDNTKKDFDNTKKDFETRLKKLEEAKK